MPARTAALAIGLACLAAAPAFAADAYPARPVKLITQGAAGSGPDLVTRIVADGLSRRWGQAVAVANVSGGGGVMAAQGAAAAAADGYTLYAPTITTFVIMPEMFDTLPVDLERDFVAVGLLAETPMMIGVGASAGMRTLDELIGMAKSKPGEVFYAANNRGSLPHLTGEMFAKRAGLKLTFVPYAGAAAGLQDVLGGRVAMIVESVGALSGAVAGGSVKPLAVTSAQRLAKWPDVPTVAETVPGFAAIAWFALMAPARTPPEIVARISRDLDAVLAMPDVRLRLEELGALPRPLSPAQTQAFIRSEQEAWRPVVREIGLRSK